MSKFPHDDFAKAYLTELLSVIGTARPNRPFKAETQVADLWFELNPNLRSQRHRLGLLGELLTCDSLIEVFRNPATPTEIRVCQSKFSRLEGELIRAAKSRSKSLSEDDLPYLWLMMPTASTEIRQGFQAIPTRHPGVYEFGKFQHMGLIVVHQLSKTQDTLWLRILGRSGEQRRAIEEFSQQPSQNNLYASIEELLADYRASLESRQQITPEDEELIMNLSAAYLKKQQEWKQEGLEQGLEQGLVQGLEQSRREIAITLLQEGVAIELVAKGTGLPIAQLDAMRQHL
jgi:hypothetical protein